MKIKSRALGVLLAASFTLALALKAQNLYVLSGTGVATIGEYGLDGSIVNASLITGVASPSDITISGNDLFVVSYNSVSEYTTSGGTVWAPLFSPSPVLNSDKIAISGTNIFCIVGADPEAVAEYNSTGQTINASLIAGLTNNAIALAISGNDIFVLNSGTRGTNGTVGEYTLSGAVVNPSLISGLSNPFAITISGNDIFVAANGNGPESVSEYTTSGATVNAPLIEVMGRITGIAVSGNDVFVASATAVGEYTTSGATVNPSINSTFQGMFISGIAISEATQGPLPQLGIAPVGNQSVLFYPPSASGENYVIQSVTNLASTNWMSETNGVPIVGVMITNSMPAKFFRLQVSQ